jgi:phenylalanyl-tRNA synthetase alpha chain
MDLQKQIQDWIEEVKGVELTSDQELGAFKSRFTGKKGVLSQIGKEFATLNSEEKAQVGRLLNELRQLIDTKVNRYYETKRKKQVIDSVLDPSLPPRSVPGALHPLAFVTERVVSIFRQWGFQVADGPEIEDDWHNFTALNFEEDHPARDMQDTFFLDDQKQWLLRTHTSTVQIRIMESISPPIRILAPGRVYRNEDISARAHCFFHQIEGLAVDTQSSFAEMKGLLHAFVRRFFERNEIRVRFRPSYFPFTEVSAEMDIECLICKGEGCSVCKESGWVEILGCGMVDPNVLRNCGIASNKYQGYAFGMGVERLAQLLFQIPDIRLYTLNYADFLHQFSFV